MNPTVIKVLRVSGAAALLGAAGSFLLDGWSTAVPLYRYGYFLVFTAMLSLSGVFCSLKLKDNKGARTFLGISTAILPVHFAQLAAFLFAALFGVSTNMPELFRFSAVELIPTAATIGAAGLVLSFVSYFGFSVLARGSAREITIVYLICNLGLLVPYRGPLTTTLIGGALCFLAFYSDITRFRPEAALRTFEGVVSRAMLYLPVLLLLARNSFHSTDGLIVGAALLAIGCFLFFGAKEIELFSQDSKWVIGLSQGFGSLSTCAGLIQLWSLLPGDSVVLKIALPTALGVQLLSFRCVFGGSFYRMLGPIIALAVYLISGFGLELLDAIALTGLGVLTIFIGSRQKEVMLKYNGLIVLVLGSIEMVSALIVAPWIALAGVGVSAVLLSSYLEGAEV